MRSQAAAFRSLVVWWLSPKRKARRILRQHRRILRIAFVVPRRGQKLSKDGEFYITEDGSTKYPITAGIPVLIEADAQEVK